jgi:hypothetical protein
MTVSAGPAVPVPAAPRPPETAARRKADEPARPVVGPGTDSAPGTVARAAAWAVALLPVALILGGALWLIVGQISRPFVYDDVSFILGARAIADTGLPFGNQGYMLHLYGDQQQWALWHPPLYLYLLGLVVALFGDGERAARSIGVVSLLVAAGFAFDLARRVTLQQGGHPVQSLAAGVVAVGLYALNPLAIQATMVLDIDNTVLMLLVIVQVWLAIRLPGSWGARTVLLVALLYAIALWAKMTTPLALGVALVFTRLFQSVGWRGALQAAVAVALGWGIFIVTWLGISAAAGLPIDYTLDVVRNELIESSHSSRDRLVSLNAFVMGVAPAILWVGPFFCLLFVAAGLPRLWHLVRGKGLTAGDLLVVLGAAIYLAYIFKLAGSFPKYDAAMLPLWAAASAVLVARTAGRPRLTQVAAALLAGAWLVWWYWNRMPDAWGVLWEETLNYQLVIVPLLVGLGLAVVWALLGRRNRLGGLPVALLVVTLSWSVTLNLTHQALIGSTSYYYGRYGQREAAAAVDALRRPGEMVVAAKEVGWYTASRQYVDQESWQHVVWDIQGPQQFDDTYLGIPIRILALEVGEESLRWAYDGLLLRRGYEYADQHGNFLIYVKP